MSNVLTVVFDKVEQKLDPVIAAAVNELHNLGHIVKEVRVMSDSGEVKVALNTVEGILHPTAPAEPPAPPAADAPPPAPPAEVPPPAADAPTTTSTVEGAPVDTPPPPPADVTAQPTIDQQREALLKQLEDLDKQEEADEAAAGSSDPTNSPGGTSTPVTA